jgi:hypothetical protein
LSLSVKNLFFGHDEIVSQVESCAEVFNYDIKEVNRLYEPKYYAYVNDTKDYYENFKV